MASKYEGKMSSDDLNKYLPVFLYSHASYPICCNEEEKKNDSCEKGNPTLSGEVDEKNTHTVMTEQNLTFKVPKKVIIVDPIPEGYYCLSDEMVDHLFPELITRMNNNWFLTSKSEEELWNKIEKKQNETNETFIYQYEMGPINNLYNYTKIFNSNDEMINYKIAFDSGDENIPWNVRYGYKSGNDYILDKMNIRTQSYNDKRNESCIFLNDMIDIIKNQFDVLKKNKWANNYEGIIIYLISCRGNPADVLKPEEYQIINENGKKANYELKGVEEGKKSNLGPTRGHENFQIADQVCDIDVIKKCSRRGKKRIINRRATLGKRKREGGRRRKTKKRITRRKKKKRIKKTKKRRRRRR